jgi:DOPA 4,5-dioxygenase
MQADPAMDDDGGLAPWHAHVYFTQADRAAAHALHRRFTEMKESGALPDLLFVGRPCEGPAGPHPIPQYEIHFHRRSLPAVMALLQASGLRALVHPLTHDDLADHTTLARWIGEPLVLDLTTLDPPGVNQGFARFGKSDF